MKRTPSNWADSLAFIKGFCIGASVIAVLLAIYYAYFA